MAAGYRIYRRPTPTGTDELVTTLAPGVDHVDLTGFAEGEEAYFHVKAVNELDIEDTESPVLVRVAFDDDGELITPVPNAPFGLRLFEEGGGVFAIWTYITSGQTVAPAAFNLYIRVNGEPPTWSLAVSVDYTIKQNFTAEIPVSFDHGDVIEARVRAAAADDSEEQNAQTASLVFDSEAPDAPADLSVEVEAE